MRRQFDFPNSASAWQFMRECDALGVSAGFPFPTPFPAHAAGNGGLWMRAPQPVVRAPYAVLVDASDEQRARHDLHKLAEDCRTRD